MPRHRQRANQLRCATVPDAWTASLGFGRASYRGRVTSFARRERTALCDLASALEPESPTLIDQWTVHDLLAHLAVRDSDPVGASGILLPPLAGLADRAMRKAKKMGYFDLLEKVRRPPVWSPARLGPFEAMVNPVELYVHHEDIRRARDAWAPRQLDSGDETLLWRVLHVLGRALVARAGLPIDIERTDAEGRTTLKGGHGGVILRGKPSELVLYLYGRREVAEVEVDGSPAAVEKLREARLGL